MEHGSKNTTESNFVSRPNLQMIGAKELCELLCISEATVWRHRDAGLIPDGVKIGRSVRWRLCEIESWMEAGCKPVSAESVVAE
jgi:predicted DNA-binding transcriptional regulator AlpA